MLSKAHRLAPDWLVRKVRQRGRKVQTGLFRLFYTQHRRGSAIRFAFVVPKTISRKAVLRNKLRRKAREAIKPLIPNLNTGQDFVVLLKPAALKKKVSEIREDFIKCLEKTND